MIASTQIDLFCDDVIRDPYPAYAELRATDSVVRLERQDVLCITRYAEVASALRNHAIFSSAEGVGMDEAGNKRGKGTLLASDPPEHNALRRAMATPLSPTAITALRPAIQAAADELVDSLLDRDTFDVITDFARVLPISIVSHMVGLPEDGRENMLRWASATFNALGPANERGRAALSDVFEMRAYAERVAHRGAVRPGGWADQLIDLADQGIVPHDRLPSLFRDFMAPSLDTTINATASLLWLLGSNPTAWRALVADPSRVRGAIDEAVRLESPIRGFTRLTTSATEIGETAIPRGSRIMLLFASANRDERKWENPESYDLNRRNRDHVGFGMGVHSCAGMHLAKLEIECLLLTLIERVDTFTVSAPKWALNNILRGIESMSVSFVARR